MSSFLNNLNVLSYSNSSLLFFNSTILSADLLNRFLFKSKCLNTLSTNGLFSLSAEFKFKLPLSGNFSKFRNRIHFLMYYLFFELVVGQRPLVEVKKNTANLGSLLSKNKRDFKKLQSMPQQIDYCVLKTSLFRFYELDRFFNYIVFFLASYTDSRTITPSKFIKISVETSETAVVGSIKNLSLLSFFNLIDDLSGSFFEFNFKLLPFNLRKIPPFSFKSNILSFFSNSYGLFFQKELINGGETKVFNLRKFGGL